MQTSRRHRPLDGPLRVPRFAPCAGGALRVKHSQAARQFAGTGGCRESRPTRARARPWSRVPCLAVRLGRPGHPLPSQSRRCSWRCTWRYSRSRYHASDQWRVKAARMRSQTRFKCACASRTVEPSGRVALAALAQHGMKARGAVRVQKSPA